MVASGAVCGDAVPGNGLPVRGLWSLIPVLVAFPLILSQQPSCDWQAASSFHTYLQVNRCMSERTHAAGPATAVVLRWLRENTESTRIRSPVADQSGSHAPTGI